MATFNRTNTQAATVLGTASLMNGRVPAVIDTIIDFNAAGNVNAAADIFNAIAVPAGYAIMASGVEVLKIDSAGNSGTIQLKLGSTAQGSAVAPTSTGYLATVGTLTGVVPSGSNAFMNVVVATGAINAVIRVFLVLVDTRTGFAGVVTGTATTPAGATSIAVADASTYTLTTVA